MAGPDKPWICVMVTAVSIVAAVWYIVKTNKRKKLGST